MQVIHISFNWFFSYNFLFHLLKSFLPSMLLNPQLLPLVCSTFSPSLCVRNAFLSTYVFRLLSVVHEFNPSLSVGRQREQSATVCLQKLRLQAIVSLIVLFFRIEVFLNIVGWFCKHFFSFKRTRCDFGSIGFAFDPQSICLLDPMRIVELQIFPKIKPFVSLS